MTRRRSDVPETRSSGDPVQLQTRRRGWRPMTADGGGDMQVRCSSCHRPMGMVSEADGVSVICSDCQGFGG